MSSGGSGSGSIELIIGCMYSGKTTEFIRRIRAYETLRLNMFIVTHTSDQRYAGEGHVATHNRHIVPAHHATTQLMACVDLPQYKEAAVVFVEEAQFQPDLFDFCVLAANTHKKKVIVCGLDGDFQLNPFEQVVRLIPHAEKVSKMYALCKMCGDGTPASFSKRTIASEERTLVGSEGVYEAVCRHHYYINSF
jgi:thymidine kinase